MKNKMPENHFYLRLKQYLSLVAVIVLLCGCATLDFPERRDLISLEGNPALINGRYKNFPPDSAVKRWPVRTDFQALWAVLLKKPGKDFSKVKWNEDAYVQLSAIGKKAILAQLFSDSTLLEEKVLKGRVKNGYFSVRTKIRVLGIPLIFFRYTNYKIQLGVGADQKLIIDGQGNLLINLLLMGAAASNHYYFVYSRVQDLQN